jgi:hypothetical protein
MAMLAYNLNCWLMLFNREEADAAEMKHTTTGDGATAVSVSGGQNLAPCGTSGRQLQRSLRRSKESFSG